MNPPLQRSIKRMRRVTKLIVLIVVIGVWGGALFYSQLGPVNAQDNVDRLFVVKQGAASLQIAKDLENEGLIKNAQVFTFYARATGKLNKLKAGHFLFNPAMNVRQITANLVEGKVASITFTIPEGYRLQQIAEVLAKKEIATEKEFWAVVKEGDFAEPFLQDLPKTERRLEGYLFPDTYTIPLGMSTEDVIKMMLKRFDAVYKKLPSNKTGLTTHEVVTLASIIEGECLLDRERSIVASVFFNRLQRGQRLEADATVQYVLETRKQRVLFKDTEIDSAYNTYRNKGLPPGPIGCPGEASLRAVLEPSDTPYFYFVARKDNSGEHVFAKTFDEHKRNKSQLGY
ncbi:MAG: endolytic transglycosylase MltG [Clostridia bacterium]|nr:endolytic transglycosylase MltG [Clostridia bacterium]MDD4146180.1 endolytic transglycosylase MltG [Clostridia bacterium]MDD4665559.1 endolytic transglycosylase MltG [Clostridia bacterium]